MVLRSSLFWPMAGVPPCGWVAHNLKLLWGPVRCNFYEVFKGSALAAM